MGFRLAVNYRPRGDQENAIEELTRGVRDGDGWRVSGVKVWTSNAMRADFMIALCRTGEGERHAGLSRFLIAFISTPNNPIFLDLRTDWRVLGFAGGLAILTTILFGLVPALRAGSVPPSSGVPLRNYSASATTS